MSGVRITHMQGQEERQFLESPSSSGIGWPSV